MSDAHQFLARFQCVGVNRLGAYRVAKPPFFRPLNAGAVAALIGTLANRAAPNDLRRRHGQHRGIAASVAFCQHLPQLVGGFGALGAAAGAVVPIGVPLTSAFVGAGNAALERKTALAHVNSALGAVSHRMAIVRDKRIEDTFGSMPGSVRGL